MHPLLRLSTLTIPVAMFSGCVSMVLDHAWLDSDFPMPPPAIAPDSTRSGDFLAQAGVRLSDGKLLDDAKYTWTTRSVGGYGQVQVAFSPGFRWIAGGGYSSTGSVWTGPVATFEWPDMRLDLEGLFGSTKGTHHLVGHLRDSEAGYNDFTDTLPILAEGARWRQWVELTVRARPKGSGAWAELRMLPGFQWGTLSKPLSSTADYTLSVATNSLGLGAGWIQAMDNGNTLVLGPRLVWTGDSNTPDLQMTASLLVRVGNLGGR